MHPNKRKVDNTSKLTNLNFRNSIETVKMFKICSKIAKNIGNIRSQRLRDHKRRMRKIYKRMLSPFSIGIPSTRVMSNKPNQTPSISVSDRVQIKVHAAKPRSNFKSKKK
jgi:hypothetical protein